MNYYIIPKNNFNINVEIQLINETVAPIISNSLIFYLNDIHNNLSKIENMTAFCLMRYKEMSSSSVLF